VTSAGNGCANSSGGATLTVSDPAWAGSSFVATGADFAPNSIVIAVTGLSQLAPPLDLSTVLPAASSGCNLHVSTEILDLLIPSNGAASSRVPLPNTPSVAGLIDDAIASYRRALALDGDNWQAHSNLGALLLGQGNLDDAIASYRRAIALNPNHGQSHSNLGIALAGQGNTAEAIPILRRALELDSSDAPAHLNLGDALGGQGKLEEAIASYLAALAIFSMRTDSFSVEWARRSEEKLAPCHYNLGNALQDQGRLNEAIASYRRALEIFAKRTDPFSVEWAGRSEENIESLTKMLLL
jgi:tetratricopeptide (TPR) repeat protein